MRKNGFWLALICVCFSVQAFAQTATIPAGILFEPLPGSGVTVGVVNTNNAGPQWFLMKGEGNQHIGSISPGFNIISSLKSSENGEYLAVLSVGEGHSVVDVIDVNQLLSKKMYQIVQHIDPYPGTISLDVWKGMVLQLKSDMLLTERDKKTGRIPVDMNLSWQETFSLNVATGEITGISEGAKNPAEHYTKILLDPNASDAARDVALGKLMAMNSEELTLQYLLKVLDQEKDPKRINRLLDLINKIREDAPAK
ncbi:hypothetical protein U14_04116 [Candidatus Moduliflexus flocculans]|uniref:Secreted protein n=1 Tax=Candidatus Moduliflexus flocculans TaxID=1499966 RepID=A0A0S6W3A3_9BACT|nr:hypothetical protein U14_04116 [Candidatus Moduliflexus flocculans]